MSSFTAECYFLDVGQGACQVVNLGDGSAIVIDCGASYRVLGDLLRRRLQIKRIAALILSHNHRDHVGGAPGLVRQYRKAIDRIYFLQDRPAEEMQTLRYFSFLRTECEQGHIPEPIPLIRHQDSLWLNNFDDVPTAVHLEVLFPGIFDNIDGQASGNPNYTSGVLLLRCGTKRILFPGDAEIDAWRSINRVRHGRSVDCDVMGIPHHGGQIVRYKKKNETYAELHDAITDDLNWLYTRAIKSFIAIVSVGTSNSYPDQHPLPPQINAVKESGACVMCTQMTSRCSDDLERLRPGVLAPQTAPTQSQPTTTTNSHGESSNLACAGTVIVQIGPNEIRVDRQSEHQDSIDTKLVSASDHPLCRITASAN